MSPEELYLQLGALVQEMPDLANGPITNDVNKWLGRACALVESTGDSAATIALTVASQNLNPLLREINAQKIGAIVFTALAKAELDAPAQLQGSFIPAGHTFDAIAAVSKVVRTATTSVLLVDPYSDEILMTDYLGLVPEKVAVNILADAGKLKNTLKPAADRWRKQFGQARPLDVRLAPSNTLHDRLIIVDNALVWTLGQSFNKLAERAHTTLVRGDKETADLTISAFATTWAAATPL